MRPCYQKLRQLTALLVLTLLATPSFAALKCSSAFIASENFAFPAIQQAEEVDPQTIRINGQDISVPPAPSLKERLQKVRKVWRDQMIANTAGILKVLDIMLFRKMPAGLIKEDHPWVTGLIPGTDKKIWPENIIFHTENTLAAKATETDDVIVGRVGKFLSSMVKRSVPSEPEIPQGRERRMPHGINYIHGAVHYNGGSVIFNNFREAQVYLSDPAFLRELVRFADTEKREIVLIFRERDYDLQEYAYFVGFMRTVLPYFSNSNGPRKAVLWGNPAPYAVVNIITGNWARDVYLLKEKDGAQKVVRPPIAHGQYFLPQNFSPTRLAYHPEEKLLAAFTYFRILLRGKKGNLYFLDRTKLERNSEGEESPIAPIFNIQDLRAYYDQLGPEGMAALSPHIRYLVAGTLEYFESGAYETNPITNPITGFVRLFYLGTKRASQENRASADPE